MGCGDKKGIGSVPDPFGAGAYTASDKALRGKSGLVHETTRKLHSREIIRCIARGGGGLCRPRLKIYDNIY